MKTTTASTHERLRAAPTSDRDTKADFNALALPHLSALRRHAERLTRNPDSAEDLVQDALVRAYCKWDQFDLQTNCRAWLARIVTTTFINGYRRRAKEREILTAEHNCALGDRFFSRDASRRWSEPDTAYAERYLSPGVLHALSQLKPEFRSVVELSDLMELPYRDVAETLDIPVGTVMSRLFRARQALRRQLGDHAREYGLLGEARVA